MSKSGRPGTAPGATPQTATTTPEDEISFSDLVPDSRSQRSLYPHLKTLDGKRIRIVDLGHDGKDEKTGYYTVLEDGNRYAIGQTIAKKIQIGLVNAKTRGLKLADGRTYVPANVQGLDRGVRLS